MQESVSMHKSPTLVRHSRMNQARSEEEEKEMERQERQRLVERKAAQKNICKTGIDLTMEISRETDTISELSHGNMSPHTKFSSKLKIRS